MSIPLSICLDSLIPLNQTPKGQKSIKLLKRILSNVASNPGEVKYRKLNAEKLMPKLAAENLAPIYIIEHAGFLKEGKRYILPEGADISKISAICSQIENVANVANEGGGGANNDGLTQKQREALEWEKEQKRLEEMAERNKQLRDARRAKEAEEKKKREEAEEEERKLKEAEANQAETSEMSKMEQEKKKIAAENIVVDDENKDAAMEVESSAKQKEEKNLDASQFPPKSTLDSKMGKDGAVEVVNEDGKAMAYQWKDGQWSCVGEAMATQPKTEELDPEMLKIVEDLKAGRSAAGAISSSKKKVSKKPANYAQMTLEEKHAYAVKQRAKKQRELEKQRERNRKEVGKAQLHLQEQQEWQKLAAAAALKKKQEKESRRAKKKLLAKMRRERAQKNKEIEEENKRLRAEQAERMRQMGARK